MGITKVAAVCVAGTFISDGTFLSSRSMLLIGLHPDIISNGDNDVVSDLDVFHPQAAPRYFNFVYWQRNMPMQSGPVQLNI